MVSIDAGVYHSCAERVLRESLLARVPPDSHILASLSPLYAPLFLIASRGELERCGLAAPIASSECRSFLSKTLAFLSLTSPHLLEASLEGLARRCSSISLLSAGSTLSFSKTALSVLWPPPPEALSEYCRRAETSLARVLERCLEREDCRESYARREEVVEKLLDDVSARAKPLGVGDERWRQLISEKPVLHSELSLSGSVDLTSFMSKPIPSLKGVYGELLAAVNQLTSLSILVEPLSETYAEIEVKRDLQRYSHTSLYKPLVSNKKNPALLILGPLSGEVADLIVSKMLGAGVRKTLALTAPLHGCTWAPSIAKLKPIVTFVGRCKTHLFIKDAKPDTRPYRVSSREVA
ncbi:MAG: hypothetical protein QXF57_00925, partial [Acidilobaceae archaeon]